MAGRVNTVRANISKRNDLAEEELEESSDEEEYKAVEIPENMELDTEAVYTLHEQIGLEWPSGTVCITPDKNHILVEASSADKRISEMYKVALNINIRDVNRRRPEKEMKYSVTSPINRIRMKNEYVYTVSEKYFSVYSSDLILLKEKPILGTFALCTKRSIFYGNGGQLIRESNVDDISAESINTNEKEIFSVSGVSENVAAVATKRVALTDFRCNNNSKESTKVLYSSTVDINAVDYNEENIILAGSDTGSLFLFDTRSEKHPLEKINFHRSPITQVSFSSSDIFASSSDCEVALWDTTFTEEWEYHKYLSFVHQGQRYYKDFQFISENTLITTSLDGLCIFTPKTDIEMM